MSITVSNFKTKAQGKLTGRSLNKLNAPNELIKEAMNNVLTRVDPYETIRRYRIENAIYDQVYSYTMPSDLKGTNKLVTLRPVLITGDGYRSFTNNGLEEWGSDMQPDTMALEVVNGVKTLRLNRAAGQTTVLHELNATNVGGTVSVFGDADTLEQQTLDYVSGSASLQFNLDGSTGTGGIEVSLSNSVDLSDAKDVSALFHWLKFPDASRLNNVTLKWGTDNSNHFSKQVSAPHDLTAFESDVWMLNRYDWGSGSVTGSPDASDITYLRVEIDYSTGSSLDNVRVDAITNKKGEAYEMLYYSSYGFQDASGSWKADPENETDVIVLDDRAINILIYEFVILAAPEIMGKNAATYIETYRFKLDGDGGKTNWGFYDFYQHQNPSQAMEQATDYHEFDNIGPN